MSTIAQISALLRQEIRAERRNPYTLAGILLYVLAAVLIAYVALTQFSPMVWNPVFWMLLFFAAISATGRSFGQEQGRRQLYYYTLISPEALLISKLIYNTFILFTLGCLLWALLAFFGSINPIVHPGNFLLTIGLGALGLSAAFSFVAAIATSAGGNATLLSILAFPLVIPLLLLLVRAGGHCLGLIEGGLGDILAMLIALDLLLIGLGILLFPYIWRD